jgi:hypothetical protein
VLALGVLLGAEFNAAIEQLSPTPIRPPRVLDPRAWRRLDDVDDTFSGDPRPSRRDELSDQSSDDPPPGGRDS